MSFDEPFATTEWFKSQPKIGVHRKDLTDVFGFPSIRLPFIGKGRTIPEHFVATEVLYYILQIWGYRQAMMRNERGIWLGFALIGTIMEAIGIAGTHAHKHSRFMIHMQPFLPLKEMLWYPLTIYPCHVLSTSLGLPPLAGSLMTALLQSLQVMQYEAMAYRKDIHFLTGNPDFAFANVQDQLGKGPWMNIYANFAIAATSSLLARAAGSDGKAFLLMSTLGMPLACTLGFYPMNVLKAIGYIMGGEAKTPVHMWSVEEWKDTYTQCMTQSPVRENTVTKLTIIASAYIVAREFRKNAPFKLSSKDASFVLRSNMAYHALLGVVTIWKAPRHERRESLEIWAPLAFASYMLHRLLIRSF